MSKLARVKYGTTQLPSGKKIEVGFRQWYEWLEHSETKSFRVDDGEGYTARKETAKGYWYAYRKVEGKLHKRYIGVSKALTLRRLAEVGALFDIPSTPKLPKPMGNSKVSEELHNELGNLRAENEALKARLAASDHCEETLKQRTRQLEKELAEVRWRNAAPKASQLSSQTAPQDSPILDFPDAADLLNQLKSRRKKSRADLGDVETILELLPEMPQQSQPQLPDLYAARDKLFEMPSLGGWKFDSGEKRDRFYAFASALIEEASKLDQNYTIIQRLQSDLKQATERCDGYGNQLREKTEIVRKLEANLGQRPF